MVQNLLENKQSGDSILASCSKKSLEEVKKLV